MDAVIISFLAYLFKSYSEICLVFILSMMMCGCFEDSSSGQSKVSKQPCTFFDQRAKDACKVVGMLNYYKGGAHAFSPGYTQVPKGYQILFYSANHGHNVVSVSVPSGADHWESGLSKNLLVELKVPGVYFYKCEPHDTAGMIGVIQVGKSDDNYDEAMSAANKMIILANRNRVMSYFNQIERSK